MRATNFYGMAVFKFSQSIPAAAAATGGVGSGVDILASTTAGLI